MLVIDIPVFSSCRLVFLPVVVCLVSWTEKRQRKVSNTLNTPQHTISASVPWHIQSNSHQHSAGKLPSLHQSSVSAAAPRWQSAQPSGHPPSCSWAPPPHLSVPSSPPWCQGLVCFVVYSVGSFAAAPGIVFWNSLIRTTQAEQQRQQTTSNPHRPVEGIQINKTQTHYRRQGLSNHSHAMLTFGHQRAVFNGYQLQLQLIKVCNQTEKRKENTFTIFWIKVQYMNM